MLKAKELAEIFFTKANSMDYLAEDAVYHMPYSLRNGCGGDFVGAKAVRGVLEDIAWKEFYNRRTIKPEIIVLSGTDEEATAVLNMRAKTAWGEDYYNRYIINFVCKDGKIAEIWEMLDTKNAMDSLDCAYMYHIY